MKSKQPSSQPPNDDGGDDKRKDDAVVTPPAPVEDAAGATGSEAFASAGALRALTISLVLVVVLVMGSVAGAFWYMAQIGYEAKAGLLERLDRQDEQVEALARRGEVYAEAAALSALESELAARVATVEASMVAAIEEGVAQSARQAEQAVSRAGDVERALAELRDELGRDDMAWRLAEASFLLTRAQERLRIARDPEGAAIAIEQADARLASLAMPELIPAREAMAEVRGQLAELPVPDRVGWALRLREMDRQVSRWALREEPALDLDMPEVGARESESFEGLPWYEAWARSGWQWLRAQVAVSRDDRPVKMVARVPIDRETRLWLAAVREAVIDRDTAQTREAIAALRGWVADHYQARDPGVEALNAQLDTIEDGLVAASMPDLTPVFAALREARLTLPIDMHNGQGGNQ